METILLVIVAALGISSFLNLIFKKLGISLIVGYIITGTIIVYGFNLRSLEHTEALEYFAEFGIVFLMFTIGLEISLAKMNKMKDLIFLNGSLQVGLNSIVFYLIIHYLFGIESVAALILALAFSLSSTAIVLSFLKKSKEIHTPYGERAMGILIFQDLAVIPILVLLGVLVNDSGESVTTIIYHTAISAFLALSLLFVVGKRLFTWLLHFSAHSKTDELFMSTVLFIVMAASFFAHSMGFTYSLGAFVAGMIIAETKYYHKVEADIAPFKDILLGIFFVTIGMKIDLQELIRDFWLIVALFVGVLLLKTAINFLALFFQTKKDVALKTAISLSQVGEFALVIFAIAISTNLLEKSLGSIAILVVILSMVVTPFLLPYTQRFVALFMKDSFYVEEVSDIGEKKDHIIICGYNRVGQAVAHHLDMFGFSYIIVDNNPKLIHMALNEGKEAYLGDMSKTAIIEALHVKDAAAIIIALENADLKHLIVEKILDYDINANIIVQIQSQKERQKLKDELNQINAVDGEVEIARILVERVMQCQLTLNRG